MADLGIRREDKNRWERRAPLVPDHVAELVRDRLISVAVQPSPLRIFGDEEYRAAGATLVEDLAGCRVILGVKEVPPDKLIAGKPYLFFSHVIKGQAGNMPLLRRMLELGCTLIDYELIADPGSGRRLIFFGRHAGYAGMVDGLWALGQRMLAEGTETAFSAVRPSHAYRSVDDAADFLANTVARRIRTIGVRPQLHPLVVGFTGGGNVSQGAQEILSRLPVVEVEPADLPSLERGEDFSRNAVYQVVFRRKDREDFARHLPCLTVLVNGIYWEPGEPRLVSREDLRRLWSEGQPRLRVIADVTCDVGGSIEATVRATTPDDPVFVYEPESGEAKSGVEGRGPVILAVDNLPAEFPRDASEHFGDSLYPFLRRIASADYNQPLERLALPASIRNAVIAHRGELAPSFRYLEQAMLEAGA